jgi:CheY-like chemotaxis protein
MKTAMSRVDEAGLSPVTTAARPPATASAMFFSHLAPLPAGCLLDSSLCEELSRGGEQPLPPKASPGTSISASRNSPGNAPEMEMPKPAPTNPDREIILVVDDEPAVLKIMKIVLEKSGFQVVLAGNGAEALEIFGQMRDQIRILITDMAMPGMNGLDLIRAIRELNPAVDIVATTGMTTPDQMQAINDAGVRHVLSKPCGSHQLIELIRKLFSKP